MYRNALEKGLEWEHSSPFFYRKSNSQTEVIEIDEYKYLLR